VRTAIPSTPLQDLLIRNMQASRVTNKWLMAALGGGVALVVGLALSAIVLAIWSATFNGILNQMGQSGVGQAIGSGIASSLLSALTPSVPEVFLMALRVPYALSAGSASMSLTVPILGIMIVPVAGLVLGGYVSASSEFGRKARYSVARGALIAPVFAVLVAILAMFNQTSDSFTLLGSTITLSFGPDTGGAFIYGLLWGAIFGALGGWIQHAGFGWLRTIIPSLRATQRPRLAGALGGALVAYGAGMLISMSLVLALVGMGLPVILAALPQSSNASANSLVSSVTSWGPGIAILDVLAGLIPLGLYFFTFAAGATIGASTDLPTGLSSLAASSGNPLDGSTGSPATQASPTSAIGLFAPNSPFAGMHWIYLVMLAALVAYMIGGAAAVKISGAKRSSDAVIAGGLMALPLSVLMAFTAWCLSFSIDISFGASAGMSFGPSVVGTFFVVLAGGAIGGGLGGWAAVSLPRLGSMPRALLIPARPLGSMLFPRLDQLTGTSRGSARGVARAWAYDAILAAILLAVIAIILDIIGHAPVLVVPFRLYMLLAALVSGLLFALPLLYFSGAVVAQVVAVPDQPVAAQPTPTAPDAWTGGIPGAFPLPGGPVGPSDVTHPGLQQPASLPPDQMSAEAEASSTPPTGDQGDQNEPPLSGNAE